MDTKKTVKAEEIAAAPKPVAAKPLSKPSSVKAAKPVAKAVKSEPVAALKVAAKETVKSAAKAVKEVKIAKKPKLKVVRDSFTMPQSEYQKIAQIKEIGLKSGLQVKKSEVLRAGVIALCAMDEEQLKRALSGLDKIKTGRPNKH